LPEFTCPLCGLNHSTRHYDPESLPLDILAPNRIGLGRGNGTRITGRYSILGDDDISPKIGKRVLDLCVFFVEKNLIRVSDLKARLKIKDGAVDVRSFARMREDYEALKVELEDAGRNVTREYARAENLLTMNKSIREEVNRKNLELNTLKGNLSVRGKALDECEAHVQNCNEKLDDLVDEIEERTDLVIGAYESPIDFIMDSVKKLLEDLEVLKTGDDE
jgi:predicted nuclease with TOPRIM domain